MVEALHHGADVVFGARKTNLIDEGGAVGGGDAAVPLEDVAAAGVVVRERERQGVVGLRVAFEEFLQIPRAGEGVGGGVEESVRRVAGHAFGVGPFAGGDGADLHEAEFPGAATSERIEAAFAPDDGLDEGGRDAITPGGGEDGDVLAVIAPFIPPPIAAGPGEEQEEKEEETPVHGMVVPEARGGGQAGAGEGARVRR